MEKGIVFWTALLGSGWAQAHSGHGLHGGDSSLLHYLSEPEHVAGLVLLVVMIGGVVGWLRRKPGKRRDR